MGRSRRLVAGSQVRQVLSHGRRSRQIHLDIFWIANDAGYPRLGLIVPKLRFTAVARNRLRRRLKELWRREFAPRLPAWDVVIRAGRGREAAAYAASFAALRADLVRWCDRSIG